MLKHKSVMIVFFLTLGGLLVTDRYLTVPLYLYIALFLIFIAIEVYGAAVISSGFHLETICRGPGNDRTLALSFDDGPHTNTNKILDVLKAEKIKAAFFLIGRNIKGKEAIIQRMVQEGHTIGNHSFAHDNLYDLKTKEGFKNDLQAASDLLRTVTGKRTLFFRPPYGVTTPSLASAVKETGLTAIGWSIRSFDTKDEEPSVIVKRIVKQLSPGAIILLHDHPGGTELVLKNLLLEIRARDYKIVPLPELIQRPAYA